jgi:hypothetical protein
MLDLCSTLASICCVIFGCCILMIRRRVQEVDGSQGSGLIFNQSRLFRRYWGLARTHNWSRLPVLWACIVFLCGLISCAGALVLALRLVK